MVSESGGIEFKSRPYIYSTAHNYFYLQKFIRSTNLD
jgi:hypothetical protein